VSEAWRNLSPPPETSVVGPARQVGCIVKDIDAAIAYWAGTVGAGPFFIMRRIKFDNFRHLGQPAPSPEVSLAFGQFGQLQIELIEQHDMTPSGYRDFLEGGREGPQHMAFWFSDPAEYDRVHHELARKGMFVRHESTGPGPRFAYFSQGDGIYPELELAEALLPGDNWAEMIAQASMGWTGEDPIRLADGSPEPQSAT